MNEELNVMENNEIDEVEETGVVECEETTGTSSGIGVKVLICVGTAVAGAIALFKNRDKIAARNIEKKIKKLEKKGYVVYKAEDVEIREVEETEDVETSDEE